MTGWAKLGIAAGAALLVGWTLVSVYNAIWQRGYDECQAQIAAVQADNRDVAEADETLAQGVADSSGQQWQAVLAALAAQRAPIVVKVQDDLKADPRLSADQCRIPDSVRDAQIALRRIANGAPEPAVDPGGAAPAAATR